MCTLIPYVHVEDMTAYPWGLEEKARSLQCLFKTMIVCCSAVVCLTVSMRQGWAEGSEQVTHALLERDDHLSPADSQGLGYEVTRKESSKRVERAGKNAWKNSIDMFFFWCNDHWYLYDTQLNNQYDHLYCTVCPLIFLKHSSYII